MLDCHPQAYRIVIVGGGSAGISVAARLFRALKHPDIAIIDPAADHFLNALAAGR